MKNTVFLSLLFALCALNTSAQWKPAGDKIKTDWAAQIDPEHVLPEYPRPIMERSEWQNLNGLWNYAVIDKGALCHTIMRVRFWCLLPSNPHFRV